MLLLPFPLYMDTEHIQVPSGNRTEVALGQNTSIIHRVLQDAGESDLHQYAGFSGQMFAIGGTKVNGSVYVTYSTSCCDFPDASLEVLSCVTVQVEVTGNAHTNGGLVELYLYNQTSFNLQILSTIEIVVTTPTGRQWESGYGGRE